TPKHPAAENRDFKFTEDMDDRFELETDFEYAKRMNALVYNSITFFKGAFVIPVYDNYILWARASIIRDYYYVFYDFADWRKAINRGVGVCTQYAIALSELLNENGFKTYVAILNSPNICDIHAVVVSDTFTLDPTYNIAVGFNLKEIEQNHSLVEAAYQNTNTPLRYVQMYSSGNTMVMEMDVFMPNYRFDKLTYWLIWIIPLLLLLPLIYRKILKNRKR
ncbi:unnamed protein product, partial [marine sediment metagenome]